MNYNSELDELDGHGDLPDTDGVNREEDMGPSAADTQKKFGDDDIAGEINEFLKTPRFQGDICITLSMPDSYLKKAKDKVNLAIWNAYRKYARTVERVDPDGNKVRIPGFGMMDIVMTLASHVDPVKFSQILENDIKQKMAEERGIKITDAELEHIAKHPVKFDDVNNDVPEDDMADAIRQANVTESIVPCPECHGDGVIGRARCHLCLGKGKVRCIVEVKSAENDKGSVAEQASSMDIDIDSIMESMDNGKV